jgi:hypothetical protein
MCVGGEICKLKAQHKGPVEERKNCAVHASFRWRASISSQAIVAKYLVAWMPRGEIISARNIHQGIAQSFVEIRTKGAPTPQFQSHISNSQVLRNAKWNMLTYLPVFSRG